MFGGIDSNIRNLFQKYKNNYYFIKNKSRYNVLMYNECHTKSIPLFVDSNFGGGGGGDDDGPNILWLIITLSIGYISTKANKYYQNKIENENENKRKEKENENKRKEKENENKRKEKEN
jgi:hypothetical protein